MWSCQQSRRHAFHKVTTIYPKEEDLVELVSDSSNSCESMPCFEWAFVPNTNLFDVRSFAVYTKSVLINILQVIDNKVQLDLAIKACGLQRTLNIKTTLSYRVKEERKRRVEELEREKSEIYLTCCHYARGKRHSTCTGGHYTRRYSSHRYCKSGKRTVIRWLVAWSLFEDPKSYTK